MPGLPARQLDYYSTAPMWRGLRVTWALTSQTLSLYILPSDDSAAYISPDDELRDTRGGCGSGERGEVKPSERCAELRTRDKAQ